MAINCREFNQPLLKMEIDPGKCYLHFKPSCSSKMKAERWFHIFIKTIKAETQCKEAAKAENIPHTLSGSFGEVGRFGSWLACRKPLCYSILLEENHTHKPPKSSITIKAATLLCMLLRLEQEWETRGHTHWVTDSLELGAKLIQPS